MSNKKLEGQPKDLGGLIFLMDDRLANSGRNPIDVWEGQLKAEVIQLPTDLRPAVVKYVDTIIALTRSGSLKPDDYAQNIIKDCGQIPMGWRSFVYSMGRVHDQMVEKAGSGTDENAQRVAAALSTSFQEVIYKTGFRYEGDMGRTMGYLFEKIRRFPQEPTPSAAT